MDGRYGGQPGSGPAPRPADFEPPDGAFLVARQDGRVVGCGGISRLDADTAEVRRMYVAPAARGQGISRVILEQLLRQARGLGYRQARLETGNRQPEAIGLYRSAGFQPIPCWGPFAGDPRSVCFEVRLLA
ncbi:MAG: GNAT family N-acetyltransferase [Chloroflexota bacterium]